MVSGASRDRVGGRHGDALRVWTTAPPEHGRANDAVAALVSDHLGGAGGDVIRGGASRRKRVLVRGIDATAAERILGSQ